MIIFVTIFSTFLKFWALVTNLYKINCYKMKWWTVLIKKQPCFVMQILIFYHFKPSRKWHSASEHPLLGTRFLKNLCHFFSYSRFLNRPTCLLARTLSDTCEKWVIGKGVCMMHVLPPGGNSNWIYNVVPVIAPVNIWRQY